MICRLLVVNLVWNEIVCCATILKETIEIKWKIEKNLFKIEKPCASGIISRQNWKFDTIQTSVSVYSIFDVHKKKDKNIYIDKDAIV